MKLLSQVSTDETARHSHVYYLDTTKKGTSRDKGDWFVDAGTIGEEVTGTARTTEAVGGNQPHNNIPPVIASYAWRRTA